MENDQAEKKRSEKQSERLVGCQKIRLYPANPDRWFDILSLHRRAYNLAVEAIIAKTAKSKTKLRAKIREQVKKEWHASNRTFISVVSDEAVNAAYITWKACLRKWKNKEAAKLNFKSCKEPKQHFVVQKLSKKGVFPNVLKTKHISEMPNKESVKSMAAVVYENGRWFLCCKKFVTTKSKQVSENQASLSVDKVVSLDPGVRTFMTYFSSEHAGKYGDGFSVGKILPLLLRRQKELSKRDKLSAKKVDTQWYYDRLRAINKVIHRLSWRIKNLVEDLHKRVAHDLVSTFDVIMLPRFESSRMVKKSAIKPRKIGRRTVKEMLKLSFHKFEQTLKWYCKKYGKLFISTTEEYTSKTRSWDGVIEAKLGSAKIISDGVISVDRDINGARGIFLRALTR